MFPLALFGPTDRDSCKGLLRAGSALAQDSKKDETDHHQTLTFALLAD
jgi:hypothetical protein